MRNSWKSVYSVLPDLLTRVTSTHKKSPDACQYRRQVFTWNRFFVRTTVLDGNSVSVTHAGMLACSGLHHTMYGSVGDHCSSCTPCAWMDALPSSPMLGVSYTCTRSWPPRRDRRARKFPSQLHEKSGTADACTYGKSRSARPVATSHTNSAPLVSTLSTLPSTASPFHVAR